MNVPPGRRNDGTDCKNRIGDGNRHNKLAAMIRSNLPTKTAGKSCIEKVSGGKE